MALSIFLDKAKKENCIHIIGLKSGVIIECMKVSSRYHGWVYLDGVMAVSIPGMEETNKKYIIPSVYGNGIDVKEEEIE